ncbi:MAG: amino acid ABC transporter substrate-binding protein [Anaerolineales bacterium]|nr:amino acid ABC transporter substrate-binding protein [Anaerolineales bacterium]
MSVDFTMPYYTSAEGILVNAKSTLAALTPSTPMGNLRVGVQQGSVYSGWAKDNLISTGLLPAANLLSFSREEEVVQALKQGQIDVAILDLLPAREYARQGGVKVIPSAGSPQQYAIALRKGSSLTPQLNAAMTALIQDGTLARLSQQYLGLDEHEITPPAPPQVV